MDGPAARDSLSLVIALLLLPFGHNQLHISSMFFYIWKIFNNNAIMQIHSAGSPYKYEVANRPNKQPQ